MMIKTGGIYLIKRENCQNEYHGRLSCWPAHFWQGATSWIDG